MKHTEVGQWVASVALSALPWHLKDRTPPCSSLGVMAWKLLSATLSGTSHGCDPVPGKGPHLQDRCSWSEGCLMRW